MTAVPEDDDDAFFASIDVDAMIAQSQGSGRTSLSSPPTVAKTKINEDNASANSAFVSKGLETSASSQDLKDQAKLPFERTEESEVGLKRTLKDIFGYEE